MGPPKRGIGGGGAGTTPYAWGETNLDSTHTLPSLTPHLKAMSMHSQEKHSQEKHSQVRVEVVRLPTKCVVRAGNNVCAHRSSERSKLR